MVLIGYIYIICFSQKKQNFIYADILKKIFHVIYIENVFSDVSESFSFYEKVFKSAGCLTCYTSNLLFLIEYKGNV